MNLMAYIFLLIILQCLKVCAQSTTSLWSSGLQVYILLTMWGMLQMPQLWISVKAIERKKQDAVIVHICFQWHVEPFLEEPTWLGQSQQGSFVFGL